MNPPVKSRSPLWFWLAAGALMLAEFLLFDRMTAKYHATVYPRWNDQIQYLTDAYTAYDYAQAHGLVAGLVFTLKKFTVQGTLHDTAALLAFWAAGPASRSAALSVNMLVFLLWQTTLFFTIQRLTRSWALAWMGFGLLLCVASPWAAEAGSAVDFRLDHGAMCLFGICTCLALLSGGFRSTSWSLAFGVAMGVTLLERFLSGVYFAVIFVAVFGWMLCDTQRWIRVRNLALAGTVAAAMALPIFWLNRKGIYEYYWVGHITGAEGLARLRGFSPLQSVQFVLSNLGRMHLGACFGWTVAGVSSLLGILSLVWPRRPAEINPPGWLCWALASLLLPAAILTIHQQKSEYVLGILVPGVVLLVLWIWQWLWRRIEFPPRRVWHVVVPALLPLGPLVTGAAFFATQQLRPPYSPEFRDSARTIREVSEYIYQTARAGDLDQPDVGVDRIVDYMDGRILRVVCYEHHKVWVPFQLHLPDSILSGDDDNVFFKLAHCDFVLFTEPGGSDAGGWPYDHQMRRLSPRIRSWCNEHLVLVKTFFAFGRHMSLYQRPELP